MIVNRRMERVLKDYIGFRETLLHIALADLDVLEQIPFFVDLRDPHLACLDGIRDHGLEVELRFDQR